MLKRMDFWAGLVFLMFGLLVLLVLIPIGVDEPKKVPFVVLSPSYYPRIIAIAMTIVGLAVTARAVTTASNDRNLKMPRIDAVIKVVIVFAVLAVLSVILPSTGFVLGSFLALTALLLLAGERNPITIGLVAILLPIGLYLFFTKLANIPIPGGVLDPILLRI